MSNPPYCLGGCGRPSPDAFLCRACTTTLTADLLSVPWLAEQLAVTLARLDRVPHAAPESGMHLPLRLSALQASSTLRHTLQPWVRTIAEERAVPITCRDTIPDMARWLATHINSLRQSDEAGQAHDELTYAIDQARRCIDLPLLLAYRGPCDECGADLYTRADDHGWPATTVIICRACGRRYDAAERREWLLSAAEDRLATATEISQAVPAIYGQHIQAGTIRKWAQRGRLAARPPHPDDPHQRPRYRVGDVIDLARDNQQRHQRTAS